MPFAELTPQIPLIYYNMTTYAGTNHDITTSLATALSDVHSKGGGVLFIPAGTWTYTATTSWLYNNIALVGTGDGTILSDQSAGGVYWLTMGPTAGDGGNIAYCQFKDFKLIQGMAGGHTAGGGIHAYGMKNSTFQNVHITDFYDNGVLLDVNNGDGTTYGHNNFFINCLFDNSMTSGGNGSGARIISSDEHVFMGCQFQYTGGAALNSSAVRDQSGLSKYIGCTFVNGNEGLRIQDCKKTVVSGCTFDGPLKDMCHVSGETNVITGNLFTGGSGAAAANTYSMLVIENYGTDSRCAVSGNHFESQGSGNAWKYFIEERGGGGGGNFFGNGSNSYKVINALGTALFSFASLTAAAGANNGTTPPAPVVAANSNNQAGSMTFGSGTTPAAGAQVAVTFIGTLNVAPRAITITALNDATYALGLLVTGITATGFTLSTHGAPAGSQANTTYNFSYQVMV